MAFNRRLRKGVMLIVALTFFTIFSSNGAANGVNQNQSLINKWGIGMLPNGSIVSQFGILSFSVDRISISQPALDATFPLTYEEAPLSAEMRFIIRVPTAQSISGAIGELPRFLIQSENEGIAWRDYEIVIRRAFPDVVVRITGVSASQQIGAINGISSVSPLYGQIVQIPLARTIHGVNAGSTLISPVVCGASEFCNAEWQAFVLGSRVIDITLPIVQVGPFERTIGLAPRVDVSNEGVTTAPPVDLIDEGAASRSVPQTIGPEIAIQPTAITGNDEIRTVKSVSEVNEDIPFSPWDVGTNGNLSETPPTYFDPISFMNALENESPHSSLIANRAGIQQRAVKRSRLKNMGATQIGVLQTVGESERIVGDSPNDSKQEPVPRNSVRDSLIGNCVQFNECGKADHQTQRKTATISLALKPLTQSCLGSKEGGTYVQRGPNKPRAPAVGRSYV